MTDCRRCSECRDMSHHWITDPMDPDDEEFEPGDYACKHCDQRGDGCERCAGDGEIWSDDKEGFEDAFECPNCKGEGVLPLSPTEVK